MSLKEICHQRIQNQMIARSRQHTAYTEKDIKDDNAFCALVADEETLKVLSACTKVYDALDSGVAVVELISKSRQALPHLDAIYFLSPTDESIDFLIKDFKQEKKPQYRSIAVFWSTSITLNSQGLLRLCTAPLLSRTKSFVDFNMHFVAYESKVFHLDMPTALVELYPEEKGAANEAVLKTIALRLSTFCMTLGDKPNIRFHSDGRNLPAIVAKETQKTLDQLAPSTLSKGLIELVIVDRSIDACTLLLHEYTYQALAYDVLSIPCCTPRDGRRREGDATVLADDSYQFLDRKEVQTLVLGEHDDLFVKYRHQHITVVSRGVSEELRKFSKDNAAAQYAAAGGKRASEKDIAGAIRGLPQYKEMLTKFWAHITLADSCFNALQQQGIFKAGSLEQDLATGVDKEGKVVQIMNCLQSLGSLVADKSGLQAVGKARLLLLYFINMEGVQDEDKRKMMGAAGLSLDMITFLTNALALRLHDRAASGRNQAQLSTLKHRHVLHSEAEKEKLQFFQRKARDSDYELSRYEPVLKDLMERVASNKLSRMKFPFVIEPEGNPSIPGFNSDETESGRAARVRATKFDWDWGEGTNGTRPDTRSKSLVSDMMTHSRKKYVFFVLGGVSFAEMRSAYDVSKLTGFDIYLGGTSILTPSIIQRLLTSA